MENVAANRDISIVIMTKFLDKTRDHD